MSVIKIAPGMYLATEQGTIVTEDQAETILRTAVVRSKNLVLADNVAHFKAGSTCRIDLALKGLNENVPPSQGFLVTVYLSGADGSLQRMYKNKIIDPADNTVVRGSFTDYIDLEIDQ